LQVPERLLTLFLRLASVLFQNLQRVHCRAIFRVIKNKIKKFRSFYCVELKRRLETQIFSKVKLRNENENDEREEIKKKTHFLIVINESEMN
jgi:hypothetical protein